MPARNSAATLAATVAAIPAGYVDQIVLVDNASKDDTVAIAERLGITVVRHPVDRGFGGSIKTNFRTALAAGAATLVQAVTSFALGQILGVAAQRAITDMRKRVQARIMHLPVRYFDSTQTGVLVSRIMNDAEGIRNLVGTGLVQLVGGLVTAVMGIGILFWLNWHLTVITILVLLAFGGGMAYAFRTLRPLFRERGKINAEVTGRLTEALGGIRVVKSYTAEKREEIVFTKGAHRLFRNIAKSMTGVSATTAGSTVIVGIIGVLMIWLGGRAILAGEMTLGDLIDREENL